SVVSVSTMGTRSSGGVVMGTYSRSPAPTAIASGTTGGACGTICSAHATFAASSRTNTTFSTGSASTNPVLGGGRNRYGKSVIFHSRQPGSGRICSTGRITVLTPKVSVTVSASIFDIAATGSRSGSRNQSAA